jgi:hypothetical protein
MALRVLVTGACGPAGCSMIDALHFDSVTLLACDCEPFAEAVSEAAQRRFIVHRTDDPEFVGDLVTLCVLHHVNLVLPMRESDQVALLRERKLFEQLGACVWVAPISTHVTDAEARRILRLAERGRAKSSVRDWFRRSHIKSALPDPSAASAGFVEQSSPRDSAARAP